MKTISHLDRIGLANMHLTCTWSLSLEPHAHLSNNAKYDLTSSTVCGFHHKMWMPWSAHIRIKLLLSDNEIINKEGTHGERGFKSKSISF